MLLLIRGLPGSGKSELAKCLCNAPNTVEFSADGFHGEYNRDTFDPDKHKWCHLECRRAVRKALINGRNVIVHNTSCAAWEVKQYQELADKAETVFVSVIVEHRHDGVSLHDVPTDVKNRMEENFDICLRG